MRLLLTLFCLTTCILNYNISNSAIAREMLWRDGLHLTNEGTNMLSNNF